MDHAATGEDERDERVVLLLGAELVRELGAVREVEDVEHHRDRLVGDEPGLELEAEMGVEVDAESQPEHRRVLLGRRRGRHGRDAEGVAVAEDMETRGPPDLDVGVSEGRRAEHGDQDDKTMHERVFRLHPGGTQAARSLSW